MEENQSVSTMINSTASKIQQLQKAFAELESHHAVTLNLKWTQLEEHFSVLQKSLKRRFTELEEQEKEFETKIIESREILEKRKAVIMDKERASLERLQEKRNAAVSTIMTALGMPETSYAVQSGIINGEKSVSAPATDEKLLDAVIGESSICVVKKPLGNGNVKVTSYPELVKLCQEMDSESLHQFISDNRKNLITLREEIPVALQAAAEPASLVLDSLKGFYNLEMSQSDGRKDSNLVGIRRTCIMLLECLNSLLTNLDVDSHCGVITKNVKERARVIAEEWERKLDVLGLHASNGNSLEAHAFLLLLATFGIKSDFDQERLSKLIPMVSRRRQTAELCRSLGLCGKMPGVIDVLVKNGRQIDAVNLAFEFELIEQFSPVSLLESYLSEAKRSGSPVKQGNSSPSSAQNDVNEKELAAIKAVIKCIEDHNLEEQFPLDPLQRQILEFEKAKAEKKRSNEVAKPQPKRPRASNVAHGPRFNTVATEKNFSTSMDRYPQYVYDNRPYAYPVPTGHHVPSFVGTAYNFSPNHGNFLGSGYQYQTAYLH